MGVGRRGGGRNKWVVVYVLGVSVGEYVFGCDDRGKASSSCFWVVGDGWGIV